MLKKLLPFIKPYRKECVAAPLLKCLEALMDLLVPLLIASLAEEGIGKGSLEHVICTALFLGLLALLGLAFSVLAQWFSARAATGFAARVRRALFEQTLHLSFTTQDQQGKDTLLTRLTSDILQTQTGINMALRLLLRSPFIVFGSMIMSVIVAPSASFLFLITILLLAAVVYGIMWLTLPQYRLVQRRLETLVHLARENLTGVRILRAFNRQDFETASFNEASGLLRSSSEKAGRLSALTNPLTFLIIQLATAYLLYSGGLKVNSGDLSQAQVIALLGYMAQILVELVKLANLIVTISRAAASAGRISASLSLPREGDDGTGRGPGSGTGSETALSPGAFSLSLQDVSFTYEGGGDPALSHLSLSVPAGFSLGIIGGTGSGKSTLLNLLSGFYLPTSGRILIGGKDLVSLHLPTLRSRIGFALQKPFLFRASIRDNVCYGSASNKEDSDEAVWRALRAAQAEDFVRARSEGLDFEVEQGGRNLSGGQRQRLALARALFRDPSLLLLDDTASALDYATERALHSSLSHLPSRPTIILVSQRIASIRNADQILVLADGRAEGLGTHEELLQTCPLYQEIYTTQHPEPPIEKEAVS